MNIELKDYIKKLPLPDGFTAPERLEFEDLVARPLGRVDLDADLEGVNSSIDIIQKTRGGSWPSEKLTKEFDFLDLAWHEREFRDANSFAYVVYNVQGDYVGCVYLYAMGVRTDLSETMDQYDADVSWWVTQAQYDAGYYEKLYAAVQAWLGLFPFAKVYYSNKVIPV